MAWHPRLLNDRGRVKRRARRIAAEVAAEGGVRRQKVTVTPEFVRIATDLEASEVRWPGVTKVAITEEHAFLYFSKASVIVIPKRVFADEGAFEESVERAGLMWWVRPAIPLDWKPPSSYQTRSTCRPFGSQPGVSAAAAGGEALPPAPGMTASDHAEG